MNIVVACIVCVTVSALTLSIGQKLGQTPTYTNDHSMRSLLDYQLGKTWKWLFVCYLLV